jgi:hypothetical protein
LWLCDEENCDRAVCNSCIDIPKEELGQLKGRKITFRCVSCEWGAAGNAGNAENRGPYYVSLFIYFNIISLSPTVAFGHVALKCYVFDILQGFFRDDKPVLRTFLKVPGAFHISSNAAVHSPPATLLHFRVRSVENVAHFNIIQQVLAEYYPKGGLDVIDLPFNVDTPEDEDKWCAHADETVAGLTYESRAIVVITDHTDPDTGDLWLGHDEKGVPTAQEVGLVSAG